MLIILTPAPAGDDKHNKDKYTSFYITVKKSQWTPAPAGEDKYISIKLSKIIILTPAPAGENVQLTKISNHLKNSQDSSRTNVMC